MLVNDFVWDYFDRVFYGRRTSSRLSRIFAIIAILYESFCLILKFKFNDVYIKDIFYLLHPEIIKLQEF
jgi:hypothetical protein